METVLRSARRQLAEQYVRATGDSGRFEVIDREAFIRGLLESVAQHTDISLNGRLSAPVNDWEAFNRTRAARQGRYAADVFAFILQELRARHGSAGLKEHLTRIGSEEALAIARRISAESATSNLRLAAARVLRDGTWQSKPIHGMMLESEESARFDLFFEDSSPAELRIAVAVDNLGTQRAWAAGIAVRVQVQTRFGERLTGSGVSLFGMIPSLDAKRRTWLAFSGVDLLKEIRAELEPGDQVYAMRLLITRR